MGKIGLRVRQITNDDVVSRVGIRFWTNELIKPEPTWHKPV